MSLLYNNEGHASFWDDPMSQYIDIDVVDPYARSDLAVVVE